MPKGTNSGGPDPHQQASVIGICGLEATRTTNDKAFTALSSIEIEIRVGEIDNPGDLMSETNERGMKDTGTPGDAQILLHIGTVSGKDS